MEESKFHYAGPHLPVRNLQETLAYYRDVLGFYDEWTFGEKDGGIRRDQMRLLFGEDPNFLTLINDENHRLPIMWYVSNITQVFTEFQERGVQVADLLREHPHGLKEFAFVDINGYYIRLAEKTN